MVYGKYNKKITNENSKLSPIGPYGKTKLRAEELINSEKDFRINFETALASPGTIARQTIASDITRGCYHGHVLDNIAA